MLQKLASDALFTLTSKFSDVNIELSEQYCPSIFYSELIE